MARSPRVLLVILVVSSLAGGCSSKKSDTSTATTAGGSVTTAASSATTAAASSGTKATDACGLLTPADLQASLGVAFGDGALTTSGDTTLCAFQTADHKNNVHVTRYGNGAALMTGVKQGDPNAKPISGLGDEAYDESSIGKVVVRVGQIGLSVSGTPAPTLAQLEELARKALTKI